MIKICVRDLDLIKWNIIVAFQKSRDLWLTSLWRQVGRGWVKYFTFYSRAKVELGVILNDVVHVKIFEPGLS